MKNLKYLLQLAFLVYLLVFIAACKKGDRLKPFGNGTASISLIENVNISNFKKLYIPVTKVGNQSVSYNSIFSTGFTGMTLDATGILPASMITNNGIQVSVDSVNVNGVTVTNIQGYVRIRNDTSYLTEYGNLAYAPVTIGDQNGNTTLKKVYFLLYYKAYDDATKNGLPLPAHTGDVFGVATGVNSLVTALRSPLSYFDAGKDLVNGFKLDTLRSGGFNQPGGSSVPALLTVGLTQADIAPGSGFIMHPISGYYPEIPSLLSDNTGRTLSTVIVFDTAIPENIIEDPLAGYYLGRLPDNSPITLNTLRSFNYQYPASLLNLTIVKDPTYSRDFETIFGINFFIKNEILIDYTNNRIGLKNN